jgi:hypothetical protein
MALNDTKMTEKKCASQTVMGIIGILGIMGIMVAMTKNKFLNSQYPYKIPHCLKLDFKQMITTSHHKIK